MAIEFLTFPDRAALAAQLAADVAENLREAIAARGRATIAVSGGSTPELFFAVLSKETLDWPRVTVTLADERWVPPTHARSNEGLVQSMLLRSRAAAARFVPLYTGADDPETGCARSAANVAALGLPFDAMMLGLGTDGHCASLFPDGDRFDAAIDANTKALVMPMRSAAAGEPRITLTLPAIIHTRNLYLHIEGAQKREVFEKVERGEGDLARSPLRPIVEHAPVPLKVYWCA
ncbi:MAG TPA: 6-phosphogluconolactonase [Rudaea sp.]